MEHTPECEQAQKQREAEIELWEANWPNYCKNCDAWGGFASTENVAGRWESTCLMSTWDDCELCIEQGKCPRCGQSLFPDDEEGFDKWVSEQAACPFCGWKWGMYVGDIKPDEIICVCPLEDSYDEYREEIG